MSYILPLSDVWDMTIDQVIAKNNLNPEDNGQQSNNQSCIVSHLSYISKMFGNQTFQDVTKSFISNYSMVLHNQLVFNRKMEQRKSQLINDFMSCQLLVQIDSSDFTHITDLIKRIRK